MNFCGFPMNGQLLNTYACPLYNGSKVSSYQPDAVCFNNATNLGAGCAVSSSLDGANDYMSKQYVDQKDQDWELALSVLFNAFIMCQVSSEDVDASWQNVLVGSENVIGRLRLLG